MRLPKNLKTTLSRKSKEFSFDEIPREYVLGKGHVKFFFDKFLFLKNRFESLVVEMNRRGFKTNYIDSSIFNVNSIFMGDYEPTEYAMQLNRLRIQDRLNKGKKV